MTAVLLKQKTKKEAILFSFSYNPESTSVFLLFYYFYARFCFFVFVVSAAAAAVLLFSQPFAQQIIPLLKFMLTREY